MIDRIGLGKRSHLLVAVVILGLGLSGCSASSAAERTTPVSDTTRVVAASPNASWADEGPFEVTGSDYRLPQTLVGSMPDPVQMLGHVVAPVGAPGPRPLALFIHGKHASCYIPGDDRYSSAHWPCQGAEEPVPNHLGYRYLQRMLAQHGYVTVSIAANGIDSQDDVHSNDNGVSERSTLIRRHLNRWAAWAQASGGEWSGRVDMDRVLLVGHSRGGQAVDRAAIDTRPRSPWRVSGQVLLAPTAFGRQAAPRVPTVVLMGYCDGELNWWPGQNFIDRPRDVVHDPAMRSAVAVMGANHAFFNTQWTPGRAAAPAGDDGANFYGQRHALCGPSAPTRLSAGAQRAVTRHYVAAAAALFGYGDVAGMPLLDGRLVDPDTVGGADVRVTSLGGRRALVRPGVDGSITVTGGEATLCAGRAGAAEDRYCGNGVRFERTPHWVDHVESPAVPSARALQFTWNARGARAGVQLRDPVDLSGSSHLDARVIVDPAVGAVRLGLRVADADGESAKIVPRTNGVLAPMPGSSRLLGRLWAQTLRGSLAQVEGVDLSRIVSVELVARNAAGHVWLLDASGWRAGVRPVRDDYVARVSVADVVVREGSGGARTVEVPIKVVGVTSTTARLRAQVVDFTADRLPDPVTLVLQPGQQAASLPITYQADTVAGPDREYAVNLWAERGAVSADYIANVIVRDDD